MNWKKTYPCLATAMEASFETLCTWCDHLPPPQTDAERTVLRRLKARRDELASLELRKQRPDLADKFNDLLDSMERTGIKPPVQRL